MGAEEKEVDFKEISEAEALSILKVCRLGAGGGRCLRARDRAARGP